MRKALLGFGLAALAVAAPAHADTLLDRVDGLTLASNGALEHFNGLLIGADGRVLRVLHPGEPRPAHEAAIDGHGRVAMPGLVAPPMRLIATGLELAGPSRAMAKGAVRAPRAEDRDLALATVQPLLLSRGITAVADMGTTIEDWQAYRRSGDEGTLNIRIVSYAGGTQQMELIGGPGPTPWLYNGLLRMSGVWIEAPHGTPRLNDVQVKNLMSRAAMDHFQAAIWADSAAMRAQIFAAITELQGTYEGDRRWRIEQSAPLTRLPDPLARLALGADAPVVELAAQTIGAARSAFAENRFGRLAAGMAADFVLLDRNPLQAGAEPPRVLATYVGGRQVYQAN